MIPPEKLLNPLKERKYVSTQLLTCCMELYYPWNIHVKEWEKLKNPLRSPCKLLVPGASCLTGIGEQPHYCAQYAPTDPKHPWE